MPEIYVYIGTYTDGNSEGIYTYKLNTCNGSLKEAAKPQKLANPSYLCFSENKRFLYSVCETDEFMGKPCGAIAAFSINHSSGGLKLLNFKATGGKSPCHLCTDKSGKYVLTANYSNGTITQVAVEADGSLGVAGPVIQHTGSGPVADRQEQAHAHFVSLTPDNRYLCAVDLGIDKVVLYTFNSCNGIDGMPSSKYLSLKPGSGPRHLDFSPDGSFMYVITELSNEIAVYSYDKINGVFSWLQTVATLPEDYKGISYCSAIHISPDGSFLYASNRGHDSIAVFRINKESGLLELLTTVPTMGNFPRDFGIDPSGSILIAANQHSNTIYTYYIDKVTGMLEPTGFRLDVPSPVCIKLLEV